MEFDKKQQIPTFTAENHLPSLPLPSLKSTLKKYLDSAKIHLDVNQYAKTKNIIEKFENGIGSKLNFYLSRKAQTERNWLEKWWFDWSYLEWRLPIAPFVNTIGMSYNKNFIQNKLTNNGVSVQLGVASLQTHYLLCYYEELRRETLPVDATRNGYLSMEQYKRLFNTCRIPRKNMDRLDVHFKTYNEGKCSTNILILYRQRFYLLNVYHPNDNNLLNVSELYEKLNKLVNSNASKPLGCGIGALTGDYRDTWAENLDYLYKLDEKNEENMQLIQEAIFVLVLEDLDSEEYDDINRVALCGNPKNRFFDKSVQLIVTKNGYTPLNADHTPFDGITLVNMANYANARMKKDRMNDLVKVTQYECRKNIDDAKEIVFVYDSRVENAINKAVEVFNKNSDMIDLKLRNIDFCTKAHIKTYKIHPDTFTQMCMQLAYYQLHRKPAPTYETASTRAYYHGRTETLRACTQEALDWCKAMCDENKRLPKSELLKMFQAACKKHDNLMKEACDNAGCDRHLLGLRLIAKSLNIEEHEIYKDIAWTKSGGEGNFIISSSCLGFTDMYGGCYPMCENGYGIFYRITDDGITFFVSNFVTSKETNGLKMHESLANAVRSVQGLYESMAKI